MSRSRLTETAARATGAVIVAVALMLFLSGGVWAWEVEYNGADGVLPAAASPSWEVHDYGAPVSLEDNTLHIGLSPTGGRNYYREQHTIADGIPVTLEARLRMVSALGGSASLWIGTRGRYVDIGVFPDHIVAVDRYYQPHSFSGDFTNSRTMRIAYDGTTAAYVWVDDQLAFFYQPSGYSSLAGTDVGVRFGSSDCDSYWQYVAYSKQFIPVPEPSSLLALLAGLGGFGMLLRRRIR